MEPVRGVRWRTGHQEQALRVFQLPGRARPVRGECPGVFGAAGGPGECGTPFLGSGSDDSLAVDYTHVFSPGFLVEGRFGWTAFRFLQNNPDADTATSEQVGIPNLNNACQNVSD